MSSALRPSAFVSTELVARLEAASVGSRELDRELMGLTYQWERRHIGARCWDDADDTCCPDAKHLDWVWVDPATDQWKTNAIDGFEFTTSLDAALALAERVLPGRARAIGDMAFDPPGRPWATIWTTGGDPNINVRAATPALALCIAILRATPESPHNPGQGDGHG